MNEISSVKLFQNELTAHSYAIKKMEVIRPDLLIKLQVYDEQAETFGEDALNPPREANDFYQSACAEFRLLNSKQTLPI